MRPVGRYLLDEILYGSQQFDVVKDGARNRSNSGRGEHSDVFGSIYCQPHPVAVEVLEVAIHRAAIVPCGCYVVGQGEIRGIAIPGLG